MKRPIVRHTESETGLKSHTFPDAKKWTKKQSQVAFALVYLCPEIPAYNRLYLAYHYGECNSVIPFARFFNDFWYEVGRFLEKDSLDLIDEKFIDWVELMQFKEHADVMAMDFNTALKRFCFYI